MAEPLEKEINKEIDELVKSAGDGLVSWEQLPETSEDEEYK